jgi:4,5-dihydroxyphthalate decarboxylase
MRHQNDLPARRRARSGGNTHKKEERIRVPNVPITIATDDYDHLRDLRFGLVRPEGIDVTYLCMEIHEVFSRMIFNREFDVSELSSAKFANLVSQPDSDLIGLPVYPSRQFRFSSFYINTRKGIKGPTDLRGKRVGLPEWAQSAAVYTRGYLMHDVGIPLSEIHWVQAGTEQAGRIEVERVTDKTLSDMLAKGEIDAAMIAREPSCFRKGHPDVVRLFPDFRAMEEEYYRKTKIFPIMHIIAMKKSVLAKHPWVARNLFNAFEESKRNSLHRIHDNAISSYPVPWLTDTARGLKKVFGDDTHSYGIEANRPTLEAYLTYAYEQGIAKRLMKPEDIFPPHIEVSTNI